VCKAVWKDGQRCPVTVEPIFPNPGSAAWQRRGWERAACKDTTPPPPLTAALQERIDAKQAEYAYLAGAMAKMGDYSPNVPIYMVRQSKKVDLFARFYTKSDQFTKTGLVT
jgi:hypothetical protein